MAATTEREQDKVFISWCIDQYLDGKVSADGLVLAIQAMVPPRQQEEDATIPYDTPLKHNASLLLEMVG